MTPAQQRVYEVISQLEKETGRAPSTREIGRATGLTVATVHYHLEKLLRARHIRRATSKQGYMTKG